METKQLIIICITIIALISIGCGTVLAISMEKETQIAMDLIEINQGDNLTITLTDENGNPIADQEVKITINNKTYNRTTDNTGRCQLGINLDFGDYEITLKYDGRKVIVIGINDCV